MLYLQIYVDLNVFTVPCAAESGTIDVAKIASMGHSDRNLLRLAGNGVSVMPRVCR